MPDATDRVNFLAEALDPGDNPWLVHESQPIQSAVNLKDHVAYIPRARTRASEHIRLHEAAHISHTDEHEHEHERRMNICKMLEEIRVDSLLMQQRQLDVRNRMDDFDLEARAKETTRDKLPIRTLEFLQFAYIATSPAVTPDVTAYTHTMYASLPGELQVMCRNALGDLIRDPTVATRERHAEIIDKYFEPPQPPPAQPLTLKAGAQQEIRRQQQEEYEEASKKAQAERQKQKSVSREYKIPTLDPQEEAKLGNPGGDGSTPRFGKAEIHDHVTDNPMASHVKAPFTRTGRGIVPEFMENYCIDKRIYRTEHRGGVIVLDCSGSMNPNFNLITQQMREFPNLVVLSYQSTYGGQTDPKTRNPVVNGRICIHAKGGKIDPHFRKEPGTAGGNSVDVEALLYGAKFKGPRVWVSDGLAHGGAYDTGMMGYNPRYDAPLHQKIREVMHQEHYIRVETLPEALAWVTRSGPVDYTTAAALDYCEPEIVSKHTRRGRRP